MNRADCINHLRAGHPMTHRVSRIIADMLEADGDALASAEESHLLRTLAEIREAMGVGAKPMLDELPGLVRAMKAEREELARAVLRDPYAWAHKYTRCAGRCRGCGELEALVKAKMRSHTPGCPVALAEKIVKERDI